MKTKLLTFMFCYTSIASIANPIDLKKVNNFTTSQQLSFEENKGQLLGKDANRVTFFLKSGNTAVFLLENGISYQFTKKHEAEKKSFLNSTEWSNQIGKKKTTTLETYRMEMVLIGANPNPEITAENPTNCIVNYVAKNIFNVEKYSKITYHNIYPNIDWVIYIKEQKIEYDFIVRPNGNPELIQFKNKWVENLNLNKEGSLSLDCKLGTVLQEAPFSFQSDKNIASKIVVNNDVISFKVSDYNKNKTLTIDPVVGWSTYFGGTGSDTGTACVVDNSNNIYLTGYTDSLTNIASGGYQNSFSGTSNDAFLAKFNSSGILIWATYYGGNGNDKGNSVAVDSSGNIYMAGMTSSSNNIASSGAQQTSNAGLDDAFLVKFDTDGNRIWATYFGGEYFDEGYSCAVDNAGNVYMAGFAWSSSGITTAGAHQTSTGGGTDGFLVKYNNNGIRQWSTYYGGELWETGYCTTDVNGNVYLSGFTSSSINIASPGAHQTVIGWGDDAYLAKFDTNGVRQWGTYYGGDNYDWAYFPATDSQGNVYITGHTGSTAVIATTGAHQTVGAGAYDAFLAKFNSSGTRIWGTYYGGTDHERASGCAVDNNDNVIMTGYTSSINGISSTGVFQEIYGGGQDAFAVKFNSSGTQLWGTYIGGNAEEFGAFCTTDTSGNTYFSGYANSSTNIATTGVHQENFGGSRDAYLTKLNSTGTLSIVKNSKIDTIKIYPNPTSDFVFIENPKNLKIENVQIFDILGKKIIENKNVIENKIDMQSFSKGNYLLKIFLENGAIETQKILKF